MNGAFDRRAAAICAFLGLGVLAIFIGFFLLPDVAAAERCARPTSLTEFQTAREMSDLIAVFSAPGGECRTRMVAAMNAVNRLDLFLFMPVYGAFLAAAIVMFAPAWREGLGLAALAAIIIALFGDALETWTQLRITRDIEAAAPLLTPLEAGFWIKYAGLALHAGLLAVMALARPRRAWMTGGVGAAAALATIAAAAGFAPQPLMTGLVALFWLALLGASLRALFLRTS